MRLRKRSYGSIVTLCNPVFPGLANLNKAKKGRL
uniref:Uncharacterized protein n=1 Tax=Rhizophora mucronata TaxID=61149 RepID=A0A2P2NKR3_RHIMU